MNFYNICHGKDQWESFVIGRGLLIFGVYYAIECEKGEKDISPYNEFNVWARNSNGRAQWADWGWKGKIIDLRFKFSKLFRHNFDIFNILCRYFNITSILHVAALILMKDALDKFWKIIFCEVAPKICARQSQNILKKFSTDNDLLIINI